MSEFPGFPLEARLDRIMSGAGAWLWLSAAALLGSAFIFTGPAWLVPLAQALLAFPVLWIDLRRGRLGAAAGHMVFWSLIVSILVIEITIHANQAATANILRGPEYREEMFHFIRTGVGPEGTPALFLPQHILHYTLTLGSSLISVGLAGLALGSVLLNYMNFYVGCLVLEGTRPVLGSIFGWPIWSVLRVVGFIFGSVAAADFFLARILRKAPWNPVAVRRLFLWSFALFLADILVKALIAHHWRTILEKALLP